jgi:hypothetical protein
MGSKEDGWVERAVGRVPGEAGSKSSMRRSRVLGVQSPALEILGSSKTR